MTVIAGWFRSVDLSLHLARRFPAYHLAYSKCSRGSGSQGKLHRLVRLPPAHWGCVDARDTHSLKGVSCWGARLRSFSKPGSAKTYLAANFRMSYFVNGSFGKVD